MPIHRLAYMPLVTYPDPAPDESVAAAVAFADALGCELQATAFALDIPEVSSAFDGILISIPELARAACETNQAHCQRLQTIVEKADTRIKARCSIMRSFPSAMTEAAADEARYFDIAVLPWSKDRPVAQDVSQSVIFGSGRPAILVPPSARSEQPAHMAVAWDGSRVAARALGDALTLLAEGSQITVLTVRDEKPLAERDIAGTLASFLDKRGFKTQARDVHLGRRTIAEALQQSALEAGAGLLAMGGFGHSRLRDFVLGGATRGVFADLRLPVLLSH